MQRFLATSRYIDHDHPLIRTRASALAAEVAGTGDPDADYLALIRRCFEFVRDEIRHSWDYRANPVTRSLTSCATLPASAMPRAICWQLCRARTAFRPACVISASRSVTVAHAVACMG